MAVMSVWTQFQQPAGIVVQAEVATATNHYQGDEHGQIGRRKLDSVVQLYDAAAAVEIVVPVVPAQDILCPCQAFGGLDRSLTLVQMT